MAIFSFGHTARDAVGTLDPGDFTFSPVELENEINSQSGYWLSLNEDFGNHIASFPAPIINEWNRVFREWTQFKEDTGFWAKHARSTRNKIIEYGHRLTTWQEIYKKVIGQPATAGLQPAPPDPGYKDPIAPWKPVIYGGMALVGAGILVKALTDSGAFAASHGAVKATI